MAAPEGPPRREPRVPLDERAFVRDPGATEWTATTLLDLSVTGALLQLPRGRPVKQRLELRLTASGGEQVELDTEVVRSVPRGTAHGVGVRFLTLTQAGAALIAQVLQDATEPVEWTDDVVHLEESEDQNAPIRRHIAIAPTELSSMMLQESSIYDVLGLDPATPDGDLESHCEALIFAVRATAATAARSRERRLEILAVALERLRPLWSDPVKRARYDLLWGYLRVEERLAAAARGNGVNAHVLAGIWADLHPEQVREAENLVHDAKPNDRQKALERALELEPFSIVWRRELARERRGERAQAVTPSESVERGSLRSLPLRFMLAALAVEGVNAVIELRLDGKRVGLLCMRAGMLVFASHGDERGEAAMPGLFAELNADFTLRHTLPKQHNDNMALGVRELLLTQPEPA